MPYSFFFLHLHLGSDKDYVLHLKSSFGFYAFCLMFLKSPDQISDFVPFFMMRFRLDILAKYCIDDVYTSDCIIRGRAWCHGFLSWWWKFDHLAEEMFPRSPHCKDTFSYVRLMLIYNPRDWVNILSVKIYSPEVLPPTCYPYLKQCLNCC